MSQFFTFLRAENEDPAQSEGNLTNPSPQVTNMSERPFNSFNSFSILNAANAPNAESSSAGLASFNVPLASPYLSGYMTAALPASHGAERPAGQHADALGGDLNVPSRANPYLSALYEGPQDLDNAPKNVVQARRAGNSSNASRSARPPPPQKVNIVELIEVTDSFQSKYDNMFAFIEANGWDDSDMEELDLIFGRSVFSQRFMPNLIDHISRFGIVENGGTRAFLNNWEEWESQRERWTCLRKLLMLKDIIERLQSIALRLQSERSSSRDDSQDEDIHVSPADEADDETSEISHSAPKMSGRGSISVGKAPALAKHRALHHNNATSSASGAGDHLDDVQLAGRTMGRPSRPRGLGAYSDPAFTPSSNEASSHKRKRASDDYEIDDDDALFCAQWARDDRDHVESEATEPPRSAGADARSVKNKGKGKGKARASAFNTPTAGGDLAGDEQEEDDGSWKALTSKQPFAKRRFKQIVEQTRFS